MERLRAETRPQHVATEAIPFSTSILAGTLPMRSYAGQLAAYLPIHRALESAIGRVVHPALTAVWAPDMRRVALIEADLDDLDVRDVDRAGIPEGEATAAWIAGLAASDPIALLGVLYVLEGSSLGGAFLRRHLAAAYGLGDAGLRYYAPYGTHPKPHWVAFSARMNATVADDAAPRVIAAAAETFVRIGRILSALSDPQRVAVAV